MGIWIYKRSLLNGILAKSSYFIVQMATFTQTNTKIEENKLKNKEKNLKEATNDSTNLDTVLKNVRKIDNLCSFTKCKNLTTNFAIDCKYCTGRFCPSHGLPEIHGCGEAVRRDEKRKFLHPHTKLSQEKHTQASDKLAAKLKQMQFERKAKQCSGKSKK